MTLPPSPDWRSAFPSLGQRVNGHPLVYLDTAATALRPTPVIDALVRFYRGDNANPSAGLHTLARRAHAEMEGARAIVARFIGARDPLEVSFTRGTTEGLNLVATAWGDANVREGDEIVIGMAEHASNMLPWRYLARRTGARVVTFGVADDGLPLLDDLTRKVTARTRVVAFSHVSNVLGMINPAREMCAIARGPGRIVVIDGAQSVPHLADDVGDLGCDFLAFSSHKMLGPMGVGALWGRRELLESMAPYQAGSNMAHDVDLTTEVLSEGGLKYSAGTPNAAGAIGLAAAIVFLEAIGRPAIATHEQAVTRHMLQRLGGLPGVRLLGAPDASRRIPVFAFVAEGRTPTDLVRALDAEGIAIRAGDLASLPLLQRYGVRAAARASCYLYTTTDDVDRFADALTRAMRA
ncbi:MAG: aminotransferase class V-fold PLP-dependent enzyme [Cytophagaceae bacterium]|nr:aminotransferase class V-fold PLP-dependent enzyme [Gemmatimonadaceae bacterium]